MSLIALCIFGLQEISSEDGGNYQSLYLYA